MKIVFTKHSVSLREEFPGSELQYINFIFSIDEFDSFVNNKTNVYCDLYLIMRSDEDSLTIFNLEPSNKEHGVLNVPFVKMKLPIFARKILQRYKRLSKKDNLEIEISNDKLNKWNKLYGIGTGQCKLNLSLEDQMRFESHLNNSTFNNCINTLITMAKRRTKAFFEKCELSLFFNERYEEYSFTIVNLHGGIINSNENWSIHT